MEWINKNFLIEKELENDETFRIAFLSLRDKKPLILEMNEKSGQFTIKTDNMELAGQIIQSLVLDHLNFSNLNSIADFPNEVENLKKLILQVEEIQNVRQQLGTNIAENSSDIRTLVVRAEDARLLADW